MRRSSPGRGSESSLESIAQSAGVTKQTLLRHFGSKDGLLEAGASPGVRRGRDAAAQRAHRRHPGGGRQPPRPLRGARRAGDAHRRHARSAAPLADLAQRSRQFHYDWIEHAFGRWLAPRGAARARVRAALIALCDVQTWWILAHDLGLARAEVRATPDPLPSGASWGTHEDPGLHLTRARAPLPARADPRRARRARAPIAVRTLASEVGLMADRGFDAAPIDPAIEATGAR